MTDKWLGTTGSSAYDDAACPPRRVLPRANETKYAAKRGNVLHLFCQNMAEEPEKRDEHLAAVPEQWRDTASGFNINAVLDGITLTGTEVSFVLDVKAKTCHIIGENCNRQYEACLGRPIGKYEIPFTVDIWGETEGIPIELDYKTGMSVGAPEDHGQRRISAAGLIYFHKVSSAYSRIVYIQEDGSIETDGCLFTEFDADDTCDKMVAAIDQQHIAKQAYDRKISLSVYPDRDAQCKYCPAFDACPYWNQLAAQVVSDSASGKIYKAEELEKLTPEHKGNALETVKNILKLFAELEDKLKFSLAMNGGSLPVGKTHEFYAKDMPGKSYSDAGALKGKLYTVLQASGMDEQDIELEMRKFQKTGRPYTQIFKRKTT